MATGSGPKLIPVVHRRDAGEYARLAAPQSSGIDAGVFQSFPRSFQQQPLLRIHRKSLTRTYPKKPGVEPSRILQKPTLERITPTRHTRLGIEQPLQIPTTILGKRRDRVPPGGDQLPQILW